MPSLSLDALVNRAAHAVRQHASQRDQDLLLAVLQYAPNDKGKANVANKILHCGAAYKGPQKENSSHFAQLSDFFWRNIIVPVRVSGGKTPQPRSRMSHSGITSADALRSPAGTEAVNALNSVTDVALRRDRHRCVISGKVDPEAIANGLGVPIGTGFEVSRVAHIIPFSLRNSVGYTSTSASASAAHLPSIWCALECFGGTSLASLMYAGINSLDNVITLSATLHRYFTAFQIALEPLPDVPNAYKVLTWGKVAPRLGLPKTVKLSSPTDVPLPNPAYLALHAAICKLVWASARAEELTAVLDDLEEVTLLAEDGSSANLINIAIYRSLAAEA
ncbi:hypothetical protein GSI_01520 [Ganoderma sinense ZZ0214-1]|uniref:HNH nuclease domain-containing protein n=1 Tax=Ganoderma sinense ZZ0214-1 TaxID=1077348 RepID=A0A2G8SQ34_9APHY|nr:hypothetical protein GSI_01520 [Ganoderma sinense ZZ0214-1]